VLQRPPICTEGLSALAGENCRSLVPQAPEDPEAGGCGRQRGRNSTPGCGIPLRASEGKCEAESVTAIGSSVGKAGSTQAVAVIEGEQRRDGED
jgi:hypothetical protein